MAAAKAAFPAWRDMPLIARSQIFFAYRELVCEHREELAALITRDHGKTFPDALAEVMRGLETVEFACGLPVHLAGMNTPNVSTNVDAFTLRQPLGVTSAITPFNFPVMVPMWIYPIAMACGNTFVWKPSSHTPGATQLQAELWKEAGLPGRRLQRRLRRPRGRDGDRRAPRHRGHPVRRLHRRSAATSTKRAPSAASGSGAYTSRQERDGRPARRRHGADGRRGRRRGLRLGRRALHGPDARHRGRRHRATRCGR